MAVLEKDISFGAEGTVFTNVNSALQQVGVGIPTVNVIGGLGGDDIAESQVEDVFFDLAALAELAAADPRAAAAVDRVRFLGIAEAPAPASRAAASVKGGE